MWKTLLAVALLFGNLSLGLADVDGAGYAERRARADGDPRTLKARSDFDRAIKQAFAQSKQKYGLTHLALGMNVRMIAQYGRGAPTAHAVLPDELDQLLSLIAEARRNPELLKRKFAKLAATREFTPLELENAVTDLGRTNTVYLDYWGYIGRTLRLPTYADGTLTFYAKWNERKSSYESYSQPVLRGQTVLGLLESQRRTKSWFWPF